MLTSWRFCCVGVHLAIFFHLQIWTEVGSHLRAAELNSTGISCPSLVVPNGTSDQ